MARPGSRSPPREPDAGVVVAITPSGRLVARCSGPAAPDEGAPVRALDGALKGTVQRVFGPVGRPYLSIRTRRAPRPAEAAALLGFPLAIEETRGR